MKLRVLIADDEPLARDCLRALLSCEPDAELVGECSSGDEVVRCIRESAPDLVLLDVNMPELDGFEVVEALSGEEAPQVIFVTASEEHAVRAFEVHALDYLLKPFGADRFREAFQVAREAVERRGAVMDHSHDRLATLLERLDGVGEERYVERLMVKAGGRVLFLRAGEVDWVEAEGNYVRLHAGSKSYLVRETMTALERKLDPRQFARVHRSTIVNLDRVEELRPWFAGDYIVALQDGTELRLSRGYRARLEEQLNATW